jgi:hypothetical protein
MAEVAREISMALPFSLDRWLRLPSRIALLLGLGAFSAAGANANTAEAYTGKENDGVSRQTAPEFADLRIWTEDGRIYVAESGRPGADLCLGDTLEARHLRQLLEEHGATAASRRVPFGRMLLVGGGGCGFDWPSPGKGRPVSTPPSNGSAGFGSAKPVNARRTVPEKPASPQPPVTGAPRPRG